MDVLDVKEEIIQRFKWRTATDRPFIVAIDGLGGAGKSTIAHHLVEELQSICTVTLIHIDNHIVERCKRYDTGHEEWFEYYYLQWDIESLKNNLFLPLHNRALHLYLPFYNRHTDTICERDMNIEANSIFIIEGIFLMRHEWRSFYDYRLFIDCPSTIREERVLQRDVYIGDFITRLHKYKKRYWPAEKYYLTKENPLAVVDSVYEV
ncbi:uridine kinase [Lysinibacillus pakistanensis]|uniref:kinase n=1 Tax=Lysinibacillus pakistanensis TaxID=759811 RepID=UPI003D2B3B4F